jgi:hypothetical protein
MKRRVVIVKRRYIAGKGFKDDIIRFTNGIGQQVRYKVVDGIKRLVPIGIGGLKTISNVGLDKLSDALQNKVESLKGSAISVPRTLPATIRDTGIKAINHRQTILREISRHLGKQSGGLLKAY